MAKTISLLFEESPEEIISKLKTSDMKPVSCKPKLVNGKNGCELIVQLPGNRKQRRSEKRKT